MFNSERIYYRVVEHLRNIPRDQHQYGYENEVDFSAAIHRLHRKWKGQAGEQVAVRFGFRRLRFTGLDGDSRSAWIPDFMLERVPPPLEDDGDGVGMEELLDDVFGFDWWREDD